MNRRLFIGVLGAGAAGLTLLARCGKILPQSNWRFFTNEEALIIEAMCDQIIPADQDPGAKEAHVVNFIDKQLVRYYKHHQNAYRIGISGIKETSILEFDKSFEMLSFEQQYQIMELLESGKAKGDIWSKNSSSSFFELVRDHTMQGYYGSPKHGGNKNYVSYKMLGIDSPIIIGQNRYHEPLTH